MYKHRVENDINFFEITVLLSCEQGNSAENRAGEIQNIYVILNFPALDFLIRKIKEREFQKIFCRSLPYFYTYPGHVCICWLVVLLHGLLTLTKKMQHMYFRTTQE